MLVTKFVNLSLELVRLLLFDHFNVSRGNFLDFGEAAVRETVSLKANVRKSCVLVQGFKHNGFDLLAEEVICQFDRTDFLVSLQSIDQEDEASII